MLRERLDTRSNNGQNLSFIITHTCKSLSAHWWPSICEVCDGKICWRFCSSALSDRRDLGNEEQMSTPQHRTKEHDISTVLRPVVRPLPVSAGLTFCHQLTGRSVLRVWTLSCQKKKGEGKKEQLWQRPFVFIDLHLTGAKFERTFCVGEFWRETETECVWARERKGEKGDTTATICSMWPSLFSIRAAIHGMVLLITAHNTFSGRAQSSSGTMGEQGGSRRVRIQIMHVCVQGVFRHMCSDNFHANGYIHLFDFVRVRNPCILAVCLCVRDRPMVRGELVRKKASVASFWKAYRGVQGHSLGPRDVWMD